MTPRLRRIAFWGILSLFLAGGLFYAFLPQPVAVDFGTATRGPLQVTIDDEGKTRVRDIYVVSAPLSGRANRITKKIGDVVFAGKTVLLTIEPSDPKFLDIRSRTQAEAAAKGAEAALALAQANRNRARAELDYARAELDRAQKLAARQAISNSALDRAVLEAKIRAAALATADAAVRVRRFELKTARASLIEAGTDLGETTPRGACCVTVRAPVDGRILKIPHESAGVVSAGEPLIEIGDPRALEIVADLLSTDAVRVRKGAPVLIEAWGGGRVLKGRVRRIQPAGFTKISALGIEEQRVTVVIDFTDPPETWRQLGHGFRVELRIVIWRGEDVLRVPVGALFRDGAAWAVFAVVDGVARKRRVRIGRRNSVFAEILDGLADGDRVVHHPSDQIKNGVAVIERDQN